VVQQIIFLIGGSGSKRLRKARVLIFDTSECDKVYINSSVAPNNFPYGINSDQLCAGTPQGGHDACQVRRNFQIKRVGDFHPHHQFSCSLAVKRTTIRRYLTRTA